MLIHTSVSEESQRKLWLKVLGLLFRDSEFPLVHQTKLIGQCVLHQVVLEVKNPPADARDIRGTGSLPGSGRSPGGGHGNPLQYSSLENPMDRGAWRAAVHGVTKSWI